jgi:hypothetical protein
MAHISGQSCSHKARQLRTPSIPRTNRLLKSFTGDNTDFSMNFIPKMSHETLLEGYKKVVVTIYSPKEYYARIRKFLSTYKPLHRKKARIRPTHLIALYKSIIFLGITSNERIYYWKLFFWSLFRRPELFPMAITCAIYGFHFRKVFERSK